jgi:hypothetical protein
VFGVYNHTDGRPYDLFRVCRMQLGYSTDAVDVMTETLMDAYYGASAESHNPRIYVYGHSQGASVIDQSLGQIPKHMYKSMHIRTFGGTSMIAEAGFGSVKNIVSTRDCWSALARPTETVHSLALWCCGRSDPKIQYVGGTGLCDHGFSKTGTYADVAREFGSRFKKEELGITND